MKRHLTIFKYIFLEHTIYNAAFTVVTLGWYLSYGSNDLPYFIWFKLLGYASTTVHYWLFRQQRLFFFHNLGVGKINFFVRSIGVDLAFCVLLIFLSNWFMYE